MTTAKGRCAHCGREFVIRPNGILRHHRLPRPDGRWSGYAMADCPGAGQPPAGADTLPDSTGHDRTPADTPTVRVGQVWQDNDRRGYGRQVRIVDIDGEHAIVELHQPRQTAGRAKPGRRTRIKTSRFRPTSTGYRLVDDT